MKSTKIEKKLLEKMLDRLDKSKEMKNSKRPMFIVWFLLFIFIIIILQLDARYDIALIFLIMPSVLFGGFIGAIFMSQVGRSQFPLVKDHINRKSIEQRLEEINNET